VVCLLSLLYRLLLYHSLFFALGKKTAWLFLNTAVCSNVTVTGQAVLLDAMVKSALSSAIPVSAV
jgi:hypothetical protein